MTLRKSGQLMTQTAFMSMDTTPAIDLSKGGQLGPMPDYSLFQSNSAHTRKACVPVLYEPPRGFTYLPDSKVWIAGLKALMETRCLTIEGLNHTLNVEYVETPFGAAGEMMSDPSKVTRARSQVSITVNEFYGKPVSRLMSMWILYLIGDPNLNRPAITTLNLSNGPSDQLPDLTGMTMLFYEPDPMNKTVQEAWLITNMMPTTSGDIIGGRDITAPQELVTYNIEFTGISMPGFGPKQLAQQHLESQAMVGANPMLQPAFVEDIASEVANSGGTGFNEVLENAASSALNPNG